MNLNLALNNNKECIGRLVEIFEKYNMDIQVEVFSNLLSDCDHSNDGNNEMDYIVEYFDELIGYNNIVNLIGECNQSDRLFIEWLFGEVDIQEYLEY